MSGSILLSEKGTYIVIISGNLLRIFIILRNYESFINSI